MAAPLRVQMQDPTARAAFVKDAVSTLEREVDGASGLSGFAVKAAFKVIGSIRSGFIRDAVDRLLDEFLDALEPLYAEALASGGSPGAVVSKSPDRTARALLTVTDGRASRSQNDVIRKTYPKLRPHAEKQVGAAAPALGRLLDAHAAKA